MYHTDINVDKNVDKNFLYYNTSDENMTELSPDNIRPPALLDSVVLLGG